MTDVPGRMAAWMAGLAVVAVACAGLAVGLIWWAARLFHEADVFYRSDNGANIYPDRVYSYYQSIQANSYSLQEAATPLVAGTVFAVLGLVAVLAVRWERRERADA